MVDDIVKYLRLSRTRFNRNAEAADEIERLRRLADDLYETGDHKASCPPDEECTCGFTDAAYEYNRYATKLYKTEQVNNG